MNKVSWGTLVFSICCSSHASAGCNTSGDTTTCTDNPYPYIEDSIDGTKDSTDVRTFKFQQFSATAKNGSQQAAIILQSTGKEGDNHTDTSEQGRPLSITLDGGSYGFSSSARTVYTFSIGGKGHSGNDNGSSTSTSSHSGGSGQPGGNGGNTTVNWKSGNFSDAYGSSIFTQGGIGGKGGSGESDTGKGTGGTGGKGGVAGAINVTIGSGSAISGTAGQLAFTGFGGAGGEGGTGNSVSSSSKGGSGGAGGKGANVSLSFGDAFTYAPTSAPQIESKYPGIVLGSIGGVGGEGGIAKNTFASGHAGDGGAGGPGGTIKLQATNAPIKITTNYSQAHAISATSLGGRGGDGGNATSDGKADGGDGNIGGKGQTVTIQITDPASSLTTKEYQAQGILAQSVGAPGGKGGKGSSGFSDGKGGGGGGGGTASVVTVEYNGSILTTYPESNGILAQSIGGFAGNSGTGTGFVAYGAESESGGAGSNVEITLDGTAKIETQGDYSAAAFAQSIGGGGGRGSNSSGIVALGGDGSAGGDAGAATVQSKGGVIETQGVHAEGLVAQSNGGSGGASGGSTGLTAIGGKSGSGGSGGTVSVLNSGSIDTAGEYSSAIVAQSTGGGGGNGHSSKGIVAIGGSAGDGGNGGPASAQNSGIISTNAQHSDGVFVQSVGGGGGRGTSAYSVSAQVAVAVGGSGGSGGSGGNVTFSDLDNEPGDINTFGAYSRGVAVQSVGGGGGHGGNDIAASAGAYLDISVGSSGSGGAGGNGGTATVTTNSSISVMGDQGSALLVQSVGGGGGSGGNSITSANSNGVAIASSIGGSGGNGGSAGAVTVTTGGVIVAGGSQGSGVVAQSIGGGGGHSGTTIAANGAANMSVTTAVGGSGGNGGNAGAVIVKSTSQIDAQGGSSFGILAQSVGGGGGNSGITVDGTLASNADVGVGVGGKGGSGGSGSSVSVTSTGMLTSSGSNGGGILAQSISQGGGNAGLTIGGSGASKAAIGVEVGGDGGNGGPSGNVTVNASGGVRTLGDYGVSLKAMSAAGGGGNASGTIDGSVASMGEMGVTIGGSGGSGGKAGNVSVTTSGSFTTAGDQSDSIVASSHGGAGGHGGFAIEGSMTGGEYAATTNVTIGGGGGSGGTGGIVSVTASDGEVIAEGYQSRGIVAASIGGNGGHGGSVYSGNITFSTSQGVNAGVSVGGKGGNGAVANTVTISSNAKVETSGDMSDGIFAQSIGGNGGYGGNSTTIAAQVAKTSSANFDVSVGGDGGTGNHSGAVNVTQTEAVVTTGVQSSGIYAQSVGGGGGKGGNAASALVDLTTDTQPEGGTSVTINATANVGGTGGAGGDGNSVMVSNSGDVSVYGKTAYGIFAQSVGGGGGDGGASSSYVLSVSGSGCTFKSPVSTITAAIDCEGASDNKSEYAPTLKLSIGGNGAVGGDGDAVEVDNTGRVATIADGSPAILAQSVGGGGGVGGSGALGDAIVAPLGIAGEAIDFLAEIAAEGFSNSRSYQTVNIVIGGSGGSAGDGSAVTVNNSGAVSTKGYSSDAINAQSVGGGGGSGGAASGGAGNWTSVLVGGAGSGGGNGGDVSVTNSGSVSTQGDSAMAIFAQSVGGGGGRAGDIARSLYGELGADLNIGKGVGIQLNAGNGGNGGDIAVVLNTGGGITTTGPSGHAIFAHSVGGSGGAASIEGTDVAINWVGSAGDQGNGGDVSVTTSAPISVSGSTAHGIFAQSVSGSVEGTLGAIAGDITIDVGADIIVSGNAGRGLLLQSEGLIESGSIAVTVRDGATVSTAEIGSDTVGLTGGTGNELVNYGTIAKPEGTETKGYVIHTAYGGLDIENYGSIQGSILIDDTADTGEKIANTVQNDGEMQLGLQIDFGSKSTFTNNGTIAAGAIGAIAQTAIQSDLVQSSQGQMLVDIDLDTIDVFSIAAGAAPQLDGFVQSNFVGQAPVTGEGETLTFFRSEAGLAAETLSVLGSAASSVSLFEDTDGADTILELSYLVDYTPWDATASPKPEPYSATRKTIDRSGWASFGTIHQHHESIGSYVETLLRLNRVAEIEGSSAYQFANDLALSVLSLKSSDDLLDAYDRLSTRDYLSLANARTYSTLRFTDRLLGCRQDGQRDASVSQGSFYAQDGRTCSWMRLEGGRSDYSSHGVIPDYTEDFSGLAGGFEFLTDSEWTAGVAAGFERSNLSADNSDSSEDRFQLGFLARREFSGVNFTSAVSAGWGNADLARSVFTPSGDINVTSDPDARWATAMARIDQVRQIGEATFLQPYADLGYTYLMQDSFSESGAGDFGQQSSSTSGSFLSFRAGVFLESGFNSRHGNGTISARAGLLKLSEIDSFDIESRFKAQQGHGPSVKTKGNFNDLAADLGLGVETTLNNSAKLNFGVETLVGENIRSIGASLRYTLPF